MQVDTPEIGNIECVCNLLSVVGNMLDKESAEGRRKMDHYFDRISTMAAAGKMDGHRLRFMLRVRAFLWPLVEAEQASKPCCTCQASPVPAHLQCCWSMLLRFCACCLLTSLLCLRPSCSALIIALSCVA